MNDGNTKNPFVHRRKEEKRPGERSRLKFKEMRLK